MRFTIWNTNIPTDELCVSEKDTHKHIQNNHFSELE